MEPRPPDLSAAGTSDLSVTAGTGPWEGSKGRGRPRLKPGSRKNKPPTRLFGMAEPDSFPTPDDPRTQPPIDPNNLLGRLPFPTPRLQPECPDLPPACTSDLSAEVPPRQASRMLSRVMIPRGAPDAGSSPASTRPSEASS